MRLATSGVAGLHVTGGWPNKPTRRFLRHLVVTALRQEPEVRGVRFDGLDRARTTPDVLHAIGTAEMLVIAPSNPIVSVERVQEP